MTKHTPATPLPWAVATGSRHVQMSAESSGAKLITAHVDSWRAMEYTQQDHSYIAHAANAYPKLVGRIRNSLLAHTLTDNDGEVRCTCPQCGAAHALLHELGEE